MQAILAVTFPFFALVLLGWLGARSSLLPESAIGGLNAYVLFFALPCMLFRFGAGLPLDRIADPSLLGVYLASALLLVGATLALTWRRVTGQSGVDLQDAAFGALVAVFPNSGFMGVPLIAALLGTGASGPVIGALVVDLVVTSTLCLALARLGTHRRNESGEAMSGLRATGLAVRGALANPMPWAIALGALFSALHIGLVAPVESIVHMLGDSATPVALFTIGAVLCRAGRHANARTPIGRYAPIAFIKLAVHPALVFGIGMGARALGAPVSTLGLTALTLTAALPSASNVSILAERYGADNGRVARIILASTVFAFATFSAIAWAFGHAAAVAESRP